MAQPRARCETERGGGWPLIDTLHPARRRGRRASGIGIVAGGAQVCARRNREKEVTAMARRFPGTRKLQRCH